MYEGPIRAIDRAGAEEAPILRQLRWTDLVARIAATRPHRSMADDAPPNFASFHLASGGEGQHGVNPDALSHGKIGALSLSDAANNAGNGDRETR
jgi:hypothetical protein